MPICLLSINHHHAPIELREKVLVGNEQLEEAYESLLAQGSVEEALLYSTCERTELLWLGPAEIGARWLSDFHDLPPSLLDGHYQIWQDEAAIDHVIQVATGLQSSIIGEPQIMGQFKAAFKQAQTLGALHGPLQMICSKILQSAKELRSNFPIGEGRTNAASAVLHLAQKIFSDVKTCKWVCLGTGQIIQDCLPYIQSNTEKPITLFSRQHHATRPWANAQMCFEHISHLDRALLEADIVITATNHPLPLIGKGLLEKTMKKRLYRPLLMADMAVPRNVEPECADLSGVYLFDIDALHDLIASHQRKREMIKEKLLPKTKAAAKACMENWHILFAKDLITGYRSHIEQLCSETQTKIRPLLQDKPNDQAQVDQLIHQLIQKILHHPTQQIRTAAKEQDSTMLRSIEQLLAHKDDTP